MALGPVKLTLVFSVLLGVSPSPASERAASLCFDLSKPNLGLLKPPPGTFPEIGKEEQHYGSDEKTGYEWAFAAGRVNLPISKVLAKFLDPMTTRDRETTTVEMRRIPVPGAIEKQHIKVRVKPIFFLTLEWEEEWLFSIKKGKPTRMESVVISYQKTNGTSHIEHFCGSILIQKLTPEKSGVFLAEEIKADRRSAEDVHRGLMGTLRTLRE
jgi:hypothetical protein